MTGPQPSGDYGYDLVHEDMGQARARGASPGDDERPGSVRGRQTDSSEDLGYDEAHDF
jgi:hypothetical protein